MTGRREDELARGAVGQNSDHQNVVGCSVQEITDYILRIAWAESAKDTLIVAQALNIHSGLLRELMKNVTQAGVVSVNGERLRGELDRGRLRRLLQHRRRQSGGG